MSFANFLFEGLLSLQISCLSKGFFTEGYLICDEIHVNSITGSTGAGVGLSSTSHFSQRNNNLSWYKVFTHQHLSEINQTLNFLNGNEVKIGPQLKERKGSEPIKLIGKNKNAK